MSNGSHYVVLYIDEGSREFSITARMQSSQLAGVDEQMAQKGYERRVLAEGLDREEAEKRRDRVRAEYEAKGYKYQTRERLS